MQACLEEVVGLLQFIPEHIEWSYDQEEDILSFVIQVPEARESMTKLLDGASQLDLSFSGELINQLAYLSFILRSGNGELALLIPRSHWIRFLEEPDRMIIDYGEKFEMNFLSNTLLNYIDSLIDRVNQGEDSPFLQEITHVFAEESES